MILILSDSITLCDIYYNGAWRLGLARIKVEVQVDFYNVDNSYIEHK